MKLLKISLLAVLFVVAISCSDKKSKNEESAGKAKDNSSEIDSEAPKDEDYAEDAFEKSFEEEESAVDGEPVPGAEIYLEQEPVGED
ncbi:MAG: hypothetical protein JXR58_05225 [Bacteroidales bacterium]|nr:hypothetical protein [Bacteroidales bacterium]